jgi:hypothetical protein
MSAPTRVRSLRDKRHFGCTAKAEILTKVVSTFKSVCWGLVSISLWTKTRDETMTRVIIAVRDNDTRGGVPRVLHGSLLHVRHFC